MTADAAVALPSRAQARLYAEGRLDLQDLACAAGPRVLFGGLSLSLLPGQWAALRGHNGSGKSTLLRCLAGLSPAHAGTVRREGDLLYQSHHAGWKDLFSASGNLQWQMSLEGQSSDAATRLAALQRVGIAAQADLPFGRLSAGQKRRLSMARLLLARRPLWLLDEPTTALDSQGQALFAQLLDDHLARGGLAVLATHLDIAGRPPDRIITLGLS